MSAPPDSIYPEGGDFKSTPTRPSDLKLVEYLKYEARGFQGIEGSWIWQDKLRRAQYGSAYVESQYTLSFLRDVNAYRYGNDVRDYLKQYIDKYVPSNDPSWQQTSASARVINAAQGELNKAIKAIQQALLESGLSTDNFVKTQTWRDLQGKKMIAQDKLDTAKGIPRSTSCVDYSIIAAGTYGQELIDYFSKEIAHCQALQSQSSDQDVKDGLKRPDSYTTDTPLLSDIQTLLMYAGVGLLAVFIIKKARG